MSATLSEIRNRNEIREKEFDEMTKLMFDSFLIKKSRKDKSLLEKQTYLISLFSDILNKYLEFQMLSDRKRKLEVINFIDKLNLQKELINLQKGASNIDDIKAKAQRFGRKSQSAFSTE